MRWRKQKNILPTNVCSGCSQLSNAKTKLTLVRARTHILNGPRAFSYARRRWNSRLGLICVCNLCVDLSQSNQIVCVASRRRSTLAFVYFLAVFFSTFSYLSILMRHILFNTGSKINTSIYSTVYSILFLLFTIFSRNRPYSRTIHVIEYLTALKYHQRPKVYYFLEL